MNSATVNVRVAARDSLVEEAHRDLIAVLRDAMSRGGSLGMHESIGGGSALRISPSKNHFALADDAAHSLLPEGASA